MNDQNQYPLSHHINKGVLCRIAKKISALQLSLLLQEVGSLSGVKMVEECCLDAFVVFVVKLSEIQFRPIFLRLLDWAVNPNSPKERLITFYHLADRYEQSRFLWACIIRERESLSD